MPSVLINKYKEKITGKYTCETCGSSQSIKDCPDGEPFTRYGQRQCVACISNRTVPKESYIEGLNELHWKDLLSKFPAGNIWDPETKKRIPIITALKKNLFLPELPEEF